MFGKGRFYGELFLLNIIIYYWYILLSLFKYLVFMWEVNCGVLFVFGKNFLVVFVDC